MRIRQNPYSPCLFHAVRAFLWLSVLIVLCIMIYFAVNLHSGGFKLPYAFLLILITTVLSLLSLIFTSLLHCRNGLRPMLSLITNFILFILWVLSVGFLAYSMRGTLLTTCSTSSWGTSAGVMVCQTYKVLFSFMAIALVFTFVHFILDIVARRNQSNMGPLPYNPKHYREDYKMHARGESSVPLAFGAVPIDHGIEDEMHPHANANAIDVARSDNFGTDSTLSSPRRSHPLHDQGYGDAEYYGNVSPVSAVRWAPSVTTTTTTTAATPGNRPSAYSPLQTGFEEQQTGYESYRPYPAPYGEGGHGYRG